MGLLFAQGFKRAQARGPTFLNHLSATADRQRLGRHILGDHRARAHIGAVADLARRPQRRVRADERVLADLGAVLGAAVVIAGDGAGTDIGAGADEGVADIAQVIDLGAGLYHGLLDLDAITDAD